MYIGGTIKFNRISLAIVGVICIFFIYYSLHNVIEMENAMFNSVADDYVDLEQLFIVLIEASIKGGNEVVSIYNGNKTAVMSKGKTSEGFNDPVTFADYHSHCIMSATVRQYFPSVNIISEESAIDCSVIELSAEHSSLHHLNQKDSMDFQLKSILNEHTTVPLDNITVWIDPLDATQEFTENLTEYVTTMTCVSLNGVPIIGVIYEPPFNGKLPILNWGWIGKGVSQSLKQNKNDSGKILISRSHSRNVKEIIYSSPLYSKMVVRAGGAGYKIIQVARGIAEAYLHSSSIKKWDICAGDAILRAKNGRLTTLLDRELDYSQANDYVNTEGLLATSTKEVHDLYLKALKK